MALASYILSYGVAVLCIGAIAAYLYFTRKFDHWKKKGIKHITPLPFVGSMKDAALLKKCIGMVVSDIYEQHKKESFIGMYAFDQPVLQIHDLELLKAVLVKDFQHFTDRTAQANEELDPLLARGPFVQGGERWKHTRSAVTPSFTSGKMKRMYELVAECGKFLLLALEREKCAGKPIPVYEVAARYTTDVIASCAFGIQGNTLADAKAQFRGMLRSIFDFTPLTALATAVSFLAPKLANLLRLRVISPEVDSFVRSIIRHTIKERESKGIRRNDLLDSLIQLMKFGKISEGEENSETQSPEQIVFEEKDVLGQAFAYLTAGFETSATTITYVLFELSRNKNVQDKLRKELQDATSDGNFSYETLHGIKYLDMVIQETLRKYPPLPFLNRICTRAYTLPGTDITLEEGSQILVPVYALQMDSNYHPNPKQFEPERFSEENKKTIINYTYMPFGEGPRNCVGMRFALMQVKSALAHLLMKYSVDSCDRTPEEITFNPKSFLLQPKNKIELVFYPLE